MKLTFASSLLFLLVVSACRKEKVISINQETYALPGERFFPEGIAYNSNTGIFYTGSTNNGDILQVDVETGNATLFASGPAQGRGFCTGLKLDHRQLLWACGGSEGKIFALNTDGSLLKSWDVKTLLNAGFVNDCIADGEYIYFTDSQVPKIYRIRLADPQSATVEEWLTFTPLQIPYGTGTNANGIEMTEDGRYLIIVVSNAGKLYRIEKANRAITEIQLNTPVTSGDGLLLEGNKLYVSRNATGKIFPVTLNNSFTEGTVGEGFGNNLLFNTTVARAGNYLLVVNGQLNRRTGTTAPTLPFSVSRVSIP